MALERIPSSPPLILPLTENTIRPLWSVMVPAYNCSIYLRGALESILMQDEGADKMQICVVDDCSTDENVEKLVQEIGGGRIEYFRQEQNVGSLRNFETCLNRSRGRFIHLLHGDDQVKPGFYKEVEYLFNAYPSAGASITTFSGMDENGNWLYDNNPIQDQGGLLDNWLIRIAAHQRMQACAVVVKRSVYETVGSFFGVEYGEDWEMWVRIAANFPVAYSPKNLALYRLHSDNISAKFVSTGKNIKDLKKVIETIQQYLPSEQRKAAKRAAEKSFSIYFAGKAHGIYRNHRNGRLAIKQAKGALSLDVNARTVMTLLKLYIKILINYKEAPKP